MQLFDPDLTSYFVTLGKLVRKAYLPAFIPAPLMTDLADLGHEMLAVINGTNLDGIIVPYGFICRNIKSGDIILVIRGTETTVEWIEDAMILQVDFPVMPSTLYPKAHSGFVGVYNTMRTGLGLLVKHAPQLATPGLSRIVVVGHSLGAALATLLAADIGAAELVTFAGPRVGNADFCICAAKRIGRVERFVNVEDLVPKVPHLNYSDLGLPIALDSSGKVRSDPHAWHTMGTYLHLIDAGQPLDPDTLPDAAVS